MNKVFVAAVAASFVSGAASAASISFSDSVSLQSTNWNETASLSKFDSSLGTLTSATVTLSGTVSGDVRAESTDAQAATVTLNLSALITANLFGDSSVSIDVEPISANTLNATAFDGTLDFGGTSGTTLTGLTASDTDSATYTGADLAQFIGTGSFTSDLLAAGSSSGSGAGNLFTAFATSAQATLTVVYEYTPDVAPVPVPAALPLLGAGLGALAMIRRRAA
ncbi:MAG: choice-of-anchor E domain-containing protein [Mangrovicoccus sp.]